MNGRTVKNLVADAAILRLIAETPLTAAEISDVLYREMQEAWAEENGVEGIDFDTIGLARLLAWSSANERGFVPLHSWQVYARLRQLEKRGEVSRITPPGGRGIMWRAVGGEGT